MPVNVRKLRDFTKMRKTQHFTKNYTNKFNLPQNHVNLVISVQSDKASTRKLEAVFGKDSLPLVIDNIVSVSCHEIYIYMSLREVQICKQLFFS